MDQSLIIVCILVPVLIIGFILIMRAGFDSARKYQKKMIETKEKKKVTFIDYITAFDGDFDSIVTYSFLLLRDEKGNQYALDPKSSNIIATHSNKEPFITIKKTNPNNPLYPLINKVIREVKLNEECYLWIDNEKELIREHETYKNYGFEPINSSMVGFVAGVNKYRTFYNLNQSHEGDILENTRIVTGIIDFE